MGEKLPEKIEKRDWEGEMRSRIARAREEARRVTLNPVFDTKKSLEETLDAGELNKFGTFLEQVRQLEQ